MTDTPGPSWRPRPPGAVTPGAAGDSWEDSPWSDESTRELAARDRLSRVFVNGAADALLRLALGNLPAPVDCERCGITFLSLAGRDAYCHMCFGEIWQRAEYEKLADQSADQ